MTGSPHTKRAETGSSRPASASSIPPRRCSTSSCRPAGLARSGRVRLVSFGFFAPRSVAVGRSAHLRFSSAKSRICAWLGLDRQPDLATVELSPLDSAQRAGIWRPWRLGLAQRGTTRLAGRPARRSQRLWRWCARRVRCAATRPQGGQLQWIEAANVFSEQRFLYASRVVARRRQNRPDDCSVAC